MTDSPDRVNLVDLFSQIYRMGITSVLIEGGAGLAWGALVARVVDKCSFFYAPLIIGGKSAPSGIGGAGINHLEEAPRLVNVKSLKVGPDILVEGRVQYPGV